MGDYLPHQGLSSYWGSRQLWMQVTAAASLLAAAFLVLHSGLPIEISYAVMTGVGTVCGVADLLLFQKVFEPPVQRAQTPRLSEVFLEPLRNRDFRRYISFMCFWNFAAMAGGSFHQPVSAVGSRNGFVSRAAALDDLVDRRCDAVANTGTVG